MIVGRLERRDVGCAGGAGCLQVGGAPCEALAAKLHDQHISSQS